MGRVNERGYLRRFEFEGSVFECTSQSYTIHASRKACYRDGKKIHPTTYRQIQKRYEEAQSRLANSTPEKAPNI